MTVSLTPGANAPLNANPVQLNLYLPPADIVGAHVDIFAFLLDATGKVRSQEDHIHEKHPGSSHNAVNLIGLQRGAYSFTIQLDAVDSHVEKIVFAAAIRENKTNFAACKQIQMTLQDSAGTTLIQAPIPTDSMPETALIFGECYRRQNAWKFRVIAQGFLGGQKPLLDHFGVTAMGTTTNNSKPVTQPSETTPSTSSSSNTSASSPSSSRDTPVSSTSHIAGSAGSSPSPINPAVSDISADSFPHAAEFGIPPGVSLSKVSLDKARPTVSLQKRDQGFGTIKINLQWHRSNKKGLISSLLGQRDVDLDLGCLYELNNGYKGVIQALGNSFGQFQQMPFIQLMGDDRTGDTQDGEWLHINGAQWSSIRRILIFAYIYEGVPNWASTDAVITLYVPGEPDIEVQLTEGSKRLSMCGIALLQNVGGTIRISREVHYTEGHDTLDQAYSWGLRWTTGTK